MMGTLALYLFSFLLALGPPESLQTARPQLPPKLRGAEEVLSDYVRAIGGAEAWGKHKSLHLKQQVEVKGMQIGGTEERWATSAGKLLSVTTINGMGSIRQGTDGKVAWSEDPINGLRLLEGAEAEEYKVDTAWNADLRLEKLYHKVKSVQPPEAPPPGKRYECVELSLKQAKPSISCFDAETHLRVLQKGTRSSPQGEVPFRVVMSDWRDVGGGMKLPHAQEMTAGPMTLLVKVQEVKFDEKIDPKLFAVPRPARAKAASRR